MKTTETLFLSQKDVVDAGMTMREAIEVVSEVLAEHGEKMIENPPKPGIHTRKDAFIHAMPGYLPRKRAAGMKWVAGYPGNPGLGLPSIMGVIVLNDVDTGEPIAIMDGTYITALRTAAVSALAARYLARADSGIIGAVGAGLQARYHLVALREVLPRLESVKVFDASPVAVERFVAEMSELVPFRIEPVSSVEYAIKGSDIVFTATGHLDERLFKSVWVSPGCLALPIHARGWDLESLHMDKLVVDDWEQFRTTQGGAGGYYSPLPEAPYAELGEIVSGRKPGRENSEERIINFNFGMAVHDILMATRVYEKAKEKNMGQKLVPFDSHLQFSALPIAGSHHRLLADYGN